MIACEICDAKFEHRLEVVEHQASLSHQIRVGSTLQKGEKRFCPVCSFSCIELAEYSKHVDSDSHIAKLRALRSKRIAMVDSCFPSRKNARWESRAYRPVNLTGHSPSHPSHSSFVEQAHLNPSHPPPFGGPNHFNPHPYLMDRPPQNYQQKGYSRRRDEIPMFHHQQLMQYDQEDDQLMQGQHHHHHDQFLPHQQSQCHPLMQQAGPSNRRLIHEKEERKLGQLSSGKKGSPKEKKKKMGAVISKVLSAAAIVKKKKKEIVTTPKVTSMDNKSKRYESLALKGGMVSTNKSRTQVMMMERQIKYSLVDGQGTSIEESRGNVSSSSIPSITAPPPLLLSPPPRHLSSHHPSVPSSSLDISFNPSIASDSTYAFCHPVHSTPHQLHHSNWPEFVRGIEALHEDTPPTSTILPSNQGNNASYAVSGGGLDMRRVKQEVREEEAEEIIELNLNRPIKQEPPSDQTLSMDALNQKINAKDSKWKMDYDEQKRKLSALSTRREDARRRFEEELKVIDDEERREREKLIKLESIRASFQNDLQKVLLSHGF